jgi:hypothetical protein
VEPEVESEIDQIVNPLLDPEKIWWNSKIYLLMESGKRTSDLGLTTTNY